MDLSIWIWVAIAAVILVIIVVVVITTRGKGEARNRERAAELRSRAAEDDQLISTRHDRADELETEAEAARQNAMTEYERADSLRKQAGESDELAAHATDQARVLHDEATHSREEFEASVAEHDETLREADRRDPDVKTDRHGNRVEETDQDVIVVPEDERLDIGDNYSGDEFGEPDAEYIDPVEHDRLAQVDDAPLEGRDENLQAEPTVEPPSPELSADYIDPADHDRLAQQDEAALAEHEQAQDIDDAPLPSESETGGHAGNDEQLTEAAEPALVPYGNPVTMDADDTVEYADQHEQPAEEAGPALDPYGNPVTVDDDAIGGATAVQADDLPRDEQGRLLDPYGNPVEEAPEYEAPVDDPIVFDDVDSDIPRDEQGRRLDPYGNPVAENRDSL